MKRSEINRIIAQSDHMIRAFGFTLPPFAYWSVDTFRQRCNSAGPLIAARCGWDITDYGSGRFAETGLSLFTLRNGRLGDLRRGGGMCYAEKLLIARAGQKSPLHTHKVKAEDIINRGGGVLVVELFGSDETGALAPDRGGRVLCDGVWRPFGAGARLRLAPGESVTLMPGDWHGFWAEGRDVLIGEVSTVNDDETDNVFAEEIGRFARIEEDTLPTHLLVSDYETWLGVPASGSDAREPDTPDGDANRPDHIDRPR